MDFMIFMQLQIPSAKNGLQQSSRKKFAMKNYSQDCNCNYKQQNKHWVILSPETGIEPGHDKLELGLELELDNVDVQDVHHKDLHHDLVLEETAD